MANPATQLWGKSIAVVGNFMGEIKGPEYSKETRQLLETTHTKIMGKLNDNFEAFINDHGSKDLPKSIEHITHTCAAIVNFFMENTGNGALYLSTTEVGDPVYFRTLKQFGLKAKFSRTPSGRSASVKISRRKEKQASSEDKLN